MKERIIITAFAGAYLAWLLYEHWPLFMRDARDFCAMVGCGL